MCRWASLGYQRNAIIHCRCVSCFGVVFKHGAALRLLGVQSLWLSMGHRRVWSTSAGAEKRAGFLWGPAQPSSPVAHLSHVARSEPPPQRPGGLAIHRVSPVAPRHVVGNDSRRNPRQEWPRRRWRIKMQSLQLSPSPGWRCSSSCRPRPRGQGYESTWARRIWQPWHLHRRYRISALAHCTTVSRPWRVGTLRAEMQTRCCCAHA